MDIICIDDESTTSVTTTPPVMISLCRRFGSGEVVEVESQSRKLPSSRYKGVVPQQNGRWGAQIYEKHQRVWLGTFIEEDEAAKAYDIAVKRFRGGDAITNFKNQISAMEDSFLSSHSKSEIVDMLRKHTYNDELEQSKRSSTTLHKTIFRPISVSRQDYLVQKTVTPSDVGKLNRLVIPKQQAEKYFPIERGSRVHLHFQDKDSKVWRFRYSYWNSSQSYVLTKGWRQFVKEKNLKSGDIVSFFQSSTGEDNSKQLYYIDWKSTNVTLEKEVQMLRLFGVNIWSKRSN